MIHVVRRSVVVVILMLAALGAAIPAAAQAPAPPPPPPRVEASAQFTFLDTNGNAQTRSLGTGGDLVWRPGAWTHSAKAAFTQNETDGAVSARSITGLFRSSRKLRERLSVYGQYDYLRDEFAGVEQRHVAEAGVSFQAMAAGRQSLRVDGAVGYLHEARPRVDPLDSGTLTTAAAYIFAFSKTSEFKYEPRYLLTLADTGAWKFDQDASLTASITSIMALKLSHTIRYSADPPLGFKNTDRIMAISLVAKLKRP